MINTVHACLQVDMWCVWVERKLVEEARLRPASAGSVFESGVSQQTSQHVPAWGIIEHSPTRTNTFTCPARNPLLNGIHIRLERFVMFCLVTVSAVHAGVVSVGSCWAPCQRSGGGSGHPTTPRPNLHPPLTWGLWEGGGEGERERELIYTVHLRLPH